VHKVVLAEKTEDADIVEALWFSGFLPFLYFVRGLLPFLLL